MVVDISTPEEVRKLFKRFLARNRELDPDLYEILKRFPQIKEGEPVAAPTYETSEKLDYNPDLRKRAKVLAEQYISNPSAVQEKAWHLPDEETLGYVDPGLGARLITTLFEVDVKEKIPLDNGIILLLMREPLHSSFRPDIPGLFEVILNYSI